MMYDRVLYKKNARIQLAGQWHAAAALTLLCILLASAAYCAEPFELIALCITGILETAYVFVFLRRACGRSPRLFEDFFTGLCRWMTATLGILWFTLWTSLWACLFVVPGLVKAFSYSQMFFIIAENPAIGAGKAMRLSKILTQGHKADLAVHLLSFFPWMVLCCLTAGIASFWLLPYMTQSFANAYGAMKEAAFRSGRLSPDDFDKSFRG